jgi:hypothetical protein
LTLDDILEEIVGRIEDEYPRLPNLFLLEALTADGVALDLPAHTPEDAIRAPAALIPAQSLPIGADVSALALAREQQMATDMGNGVAIPHARCPGLTRPLMVFGRSSEFVHEYLIRAQSREEVFEINRKSADDRAARYKVAENLAGPSVPYVTSCCE